MHVVKRDFYRRRGARGGFLSQGTEKPFPLLFVAFATAIIIRFSIPNNVLNVFEHYSTFSESGSILEKFHPGSYGILVLTILMLPRIFAARLKDYDGILRSMFIMSTAVVFVMVICVLTGQTSSLGYLIDSLFVACAAGSAALCFTAAQRRLLGNALLVIIVLSSIMAILEFFAKTRFLPQDVTVLAGETSMRADGLYSHPLMLGLCNAVAIPILYLTNWARPVKTAAITILIMGIFAAGARGAAIAGIIMLILGVIFTGGPRSEMGSRIVKKLFVIVGILVLVPVLWFLASSVGLTERFQNEGLVDDSAMARIIIFQVFGFLDWNELIWGVGNSELVKYASLGLKLDFVENSLIIYVFQFGIIGALCLVGALLNALFALSRHTQVPLKLALCTFLVVALANNTLSSKSPAVVLIFILAIAFRDTVATKREALLSSQHRLRRHGAMPAHVGSLSEG